jgi:hypothetical protein
MISWALYKDAFVIIGQISLFSVPTPIVMPFALSTISGIHYAESPTNTATESAMHLCPADPKVAPINPLSASSL